ncbi:hypothetical protein [Caballeronia sp. GaOx3]|uniref:hypothetical protein n=1 Tax=Caballeronia sp. GaOx3 TaxID=2921740 RepID=UPI002029403A|nr:hypothetical protein [Caballeronia sp. GaOx3]
MRSIRIALCAFAALVLSACSTAKLDSYVSPGYSTGQFKRVAVLPIRNQRLNAGQSIELNRAFIQALRRKNPQLVVVGGQDAISALNEKGLADAWAGFIANYATGGVPNTQVESQVAGALDVDSIIQGAIISVKQEDSNGFNYPVTQVTVRYTMFGGRDGSTVWEVTGEGKIQPYGYTAAPIFDAVKLAHDKVLEGLPF